MVIEKCSISIQMLRCKKICTLRSGIQNTTLLFTTSRSLCARSDGGIKYSGFTYFPRFPDKEEPSCEPSKLFMVQRIKPVKGNPYWEKEILKNLSLDGKASDIAIVKNIPESNAMLWKIKHLIKITPITFPNGIPTEADIGATFLKASGEFKISQTIKVDPARIKAGEDYESKKAKEELDGETLRKQLRLKWLNPW